MEKNSMKHEGTTRSQIQEDDVKPEVKGDKENLEHQKNKEEINLPKNIMLKHRREMWEPT